MVLLQPDPFLSELTTMFEKTTEKGTVWVTLKRSCMQSKVGMRKMESAGEVLEYRCLVRATNAKKTISTSLSAKDHLKFQSSYATILKAHMSALRKRERKDKKKGGEEVEKQQEASKKKESKGKKKAGKKGKKQQEGSKNPAKQQEGSKNPAS